MDKITAAFIEMMSNGEARHSMEKGYIILIPSSHPIKTIEHTLHPILKSISKNSEFKDLLSELEKKTSRQVSLIAYGSIIDPILNEF